MNTKQRGVLLIGALLFVALALFPPWHTIGTANVYSNYTLPNRSEYLGYAFFTRPPEDGASIEFSRLAIEWLCLAVVTGTLIVLLKKRSE